MNAQTATKRYTVEEYIVLQETSDQKLEYHHGRIYAMAGATAKHNRICANLNGLLYDNTNNCELHISDQAVRIAAHNRYVYPDVSFVCNKEGSEFEDDNERFLLNPCLLIEVLSEKTAEYDRTTKFAMYRALPSFKEYVLIDSRKMYVESFYRKDAKHWIMQNAWQPEQEITFHALGKSLTLGEVYRRTQLKPIELGTDGPDISSSELPTTY